MYDYVCMVMCGYVCMTMYAWLCAFGYACMAICAWCVCTSMDKAQQHQQKNFTIPKKNMFNMRISKILVSMCLHLCHVSKESLLLQITDSILI